MDQEAQAGLCAKLREYATDQISVWDLRAWLERRRRELGWEEADRWALLRRADMAMNRYGRGEWTEPELKRVLGSFARPSLVSSS